MMGNCVWLLFAFLPLLTDAYYFERLERRQTGDEEAPPVFCNNRVCPKFTVLERHETYELRDYVATEWVITTTSGLPYSNASSANFRRLYAYINGANVEQETMAMTVPVLTRVQLQPVSDSFTMYFFVSPMYSSPPQPVSTDTISFQSMPRMRVYVRSFPGFATAEDWVNQATQLAEDLKGIAQYDQSAFFAAGYNSPYQMTNRHNEIWFIAQ